MVKLKNQIKRLCLGVVRRMMNPAPPVYSVSTKNGRMRCVVKYTLVFALIFVLFWTFIIFYVSRSDPPKLIEVTSDFILPNIDTSNRDRNTVPKLFHRLWKTKTIPEKWQQSHQHCLDINPDYKLVLWDDEAIYNFIAKEYPWFYGLFKNYPYHIQRVDVARYFILYHYGGVYLDMDASCVTPFNDIVQNMTKDYSILLPRTDIFGFTNSFMIAKPQSEFFRFVIYELPVYAHGHFSIVRHTTIIFSTGPMFLSHCALNFGPERGMYYMSIHDYEQIHFRHEKRGTWHSFDTEIVDMFHFHYIMLIAITMLISAAIYIIRCRRNKMSFRKS